MLQGYPSLKMDTDEFVFKPAAKHETNIVTSNVSSSNIISVFSNSNNRDKITSNSSTNPIAHNISRLPELDAFIAEKKRQMDAELNKLARERLDQFISKEKEADCMREEEFASMVNSPKSATGTGPILTDELGTEKLEKRAKEIDEMENKMFIEMREKAKEVWKELEQDYKATLDRLHQEQSVRLAQESQLQESLKASGAVFNRELFEKVVEKCGKGRNSAYAKEKMARFWEVLERSHPVKSSPTKDGSPDLDKDKLLASLLGIST